MLLIQIHHPFSMDSRFDSFQQNGYLTIASVITSKERRTLLGEIESLVKSDFDALPDWYPDTVARDKENRVTMLTMLHQYVPSCGDLLARPSVAKLAAELLGTDVVPRSAIYLNKTPGSEAVPRHQDGHYFKISPCKAVTIWLALDDVDEENGCLYYEPGSHKQGLLDHQATAHQWIPNRAMEDGKSVNVRPVILSAGDAVVHHAHCVHYSGENLSPTRSRRAIAFVFFSSEADFLEPLLCAKTR